MTAKKTQTSINAFRDKLRQKIGVKNPMALPKLEKIVINTGIGRFQEDKDREFIRRNLELIAGQKASERKAKKSISGFKVREGMVVGYKATLRRNRMLDFLNKLINVAFPRSRDFQGIDEKSIDKNGNLTIGIPEHIIFPEIIEEDTRIIFGMEITLAPKTRNREEAIELYRAMGIPFKS